MDHKLITELYAFKTIKASSENIAYHIFKSLLQELNKKDVKVSKVTAWESDSACASYTES